MTNPKVDVVVVGAGLSGLVCARELGRRGLAVRLLEARGRWGGRLLGHTTRSGLRLDVGGQWVGATHHRLIALLEEFGLRRHPTHYDGEGLFVRLLQKEGARVRAWEPFKPGFAIPGFDLVTIWMPRS